MSERVELGRFMYAEKGLDAWAIRSTKRGNDLLGSIDYYETWRQYVFTGSRYCCFSADCLDEISAFLKRLNAERGK